MTSLKKAKIKPSLSQIMTSTIIALTIVSFAFIILGPRLLKGKPQKVLAVSVPSPLPTPQSTTATQPATPQSQTKLATDEAPKPVYSGFCLNVPVLMYHHIQPGNEAKAQGHASLNVDPTTFDSQMAYLNQTGYRTITADDLAHALTSHQGLGKAVVVTDDDGYSDFFTYGFPVIQKYHITVNLMIPTGLMNNPGYLNWDQLKSMQGSGLVFVSNHTWSHANLGAASQDKLQFEVTTAKKQLEEQLGRPVDTFAYPYGSETNNVINYLRTNGFIAAFSTFPGTTQCDSFIMTLHRTRIGNSSLRSYGL